MRYFIFLLVITGALLLASPVTSPNSVVYFDHDTVRSAFDKGAVLFDRGERYMVHASRRDKPGLVEVHHKDADIVYVLEGTATIVTGGTMKGGKEIAADEVRGTDIEGGETRTLTKGDVMIIPAGTPHWFKEVPGPFTYYVVKVR
jgi:glc operon protein GlcG